MHRYAIIVAGGVGRRAGGDLPKQFHKLLGIPMLWWSVRAFYKCCPDTEIILVLHPDYFELWDRLYVECCSIDGPISVRVVSGGASRVESVANGIAGICATEGDLIAVHDAARPMIEPQMIQRLWDSASKCGAVIPVIPVTDSLRIKSDVRGGLTHAVDRSLYLSVQTPQVFDAMQLIEAYRNRKSDAYTDDASIADADGVEIHTEEGSVENIKVTNPRDFILAESILEERERGYNKH